MDGVLVNFQSGIDRLSKTEQGEYVDRYDEVPHIFSLMDPMAGAIEAFQKLCECFDTYILTTAPWENPTALNDKLAWVKKHLGDLAYKRMITTHHKHLNRGDYLIDDRTTNGAGDFNGEHIHFGTADFPDWETVTNYLLGKS
jgi:5'(3')-deoxyribonucleotidase